MFYFSVTFFHFHNARYRQTSHHNTHVNTPVVSVFCQGESCGSVSFLCFLPSSSPDDNMTETMLAVLMSVITDVLKPFPVYVSLDAKSQLSLALLRGT